MEIIKSLEKFSGDITDNLIEHLFLPNSRLNLQMSQAVKAALKKLNLPTPLVFLQTSGTTQQNDSIKLVGLSKKSFEVSALAVNRHLQATGADRWLNTLPLFHVGGLGVYFRSKLNGNDFFDISNFKWSPQLFQKSVSDKNISFTSLVPTQVYDLVAESLKAPSCLKAIIVGGGALDEELRLRAIDLGWPLLLSYGLSECCSQVATSQVRDRFSNDRPDLQLLPHVKVRNSSDGKLQIFSEALLQGYFTFNSDGSFHWKDPKEEGWFQTEDLADVNQNILKFKSRGDDKIKISGELVSVEKVLSHWRNQITENFSHLKINPGNWILFSEKDARKENRLILCAQPLEAELLKNLKTDIEKSLLPFERVSEIRSIEALPKSELGKILIGQLRKNDEAY